MTVRGILSDCYCHSLTSMTEGKKDVPSHGYTQHRVLSIAAWSIENTAYPTHQGWKIMAKNKIRVILNIILKKMKKIKSG